MSLNSHPHHLTSTRFWVSCRGALTNLSPIAHQETMLLSVYMRQAVWDVFDDSRSKRIIASNRFGFLVGEC